MTNKIEKEVFCPLEITLKAIGGRWKIMILHVFLGGEGVVKRFGELHRSINGISQKMLTQQLRDLERSGIVHREVYRQVPPKVEYSLTAAGKTLKPIFDLMDEWGKSRVMELSKELNKELSKARRATA